jgi:hypothetical protein
MAVDVLCQCRYACACSVREPQPAQLHPRSLHCCCFRLRFTYSVLSGTWWHSLGLIMVYLCTPVTIIAVEKRAGGDLKSWGPATIQPLRKYSLDLWDLGPLGASRWGLRIEMAGSMGSQGWVMALSGPCATRLSSPPITHCSPAASAEIMAIHHSYLRARRGVESTELRGRYQMPEPCLQCHLLHHTHRSRRESSVCCIVDQSCEPWAMALFLRVYECASL